MVRGRMGLQEALLHRSHSILMVFNLILCYFSPEILIFPELLIIETWNQCHWIWHALIPIYVPLKPFWMHFSQSKSTKCEIFGCLLNSPWPKNLKKCQFQQGKSVQKALKIWAVTKKWIHIALNVQSQNLCHWNQHVQKFKCMEYQAILSISSWSKQSSFFHSISYLKVIFVP